MNNIKWIIKKGGEGDDMFRKRFSFTGTLDLQFPGLTFAFR